MNETNQVSCEAVESSSDEVTPDSNQDKSLSLMRYKDLQQLAMSLNLPGNLKHKTLVDLITAKRSNREADVEKMITEHRVNRKLVAKRIREVKGRQEESDEGCMIASHFMEPSGVEYASLKGEASSAASPGNGERPRKKRIGESGAPEGPSASSSAPPQGPAPGAEMQNAYVGQVAYPYRYAMQASPAISLPKSILANILTSNGSGQTLQLKTHLRCKPINNYGIVSGNSMTNNNSQFSSVETDNYKHMVKAQLSTNIPSAINKDSGTQEFTQGDRVYPVIHQQPQLASESNYGTPYTISHPTYTTMSHYPNLPSSHAHLQQSSFTQPDNVSVRNVVCFGYPQQTDSSTSDGMNSLVGKQSVAQVYGPNFFMNQRLVDNSYALSLLDDIAHKQGANSHMQYSVSPSPVLPSNPAKCWENSNVTSTSTASQEMHQKCASLFGNINAIWHYQGMPLNYNDASAIPSVIAHDLTMPSRRVSHEGNLGNLTVSGNQTQNQEEKVDYPDHSESGSVHLYHPSRVMEESENSSDHQSIHSDETVNHVEQSHLATESSTQALISSQAGEERVDGNPDMAVMKTSPLLESNSNNVGIDQGSNLDKQLSTSQPNTVEATTECTQELVSRDIQPVPHSEDTNMSYWSNMYPMMKTSLSPHYSSGFNTHCSSGYGTIPHNGNALPCTECDLTKYPPQSTSYHSLVNLNSSQSSPIPSGQYNHSMAVGYDYRYGQQPYSHIQKSSYSPYSGQENMVEIDSTNNPDDSADGYLQEQQDGENLTRSYVTPHSMESMWSSAQSSSQDFDNPLVTSSPAGNELESAQDSCMEGVFPDEGDLEMEDEQGLAFPNIYDYVMGGAENEAEAGLAGKLGVEHSGEGNSSPLSGRVSVEEKGGKEHIQGQTSVEDPAESACEESDSTRNDSESLGSPSKDSLNLSTSSIASESSSMKLRLSSSSHDSSFEDNGTPAVALKRRSQPSRGKSSKIYHHKIKSGKGGSCSSPKRSGSRGKTITKKDLISCPCNRGSCAWVGRIPTLASHVRSVHWEKVVAADDTSYVVEVKELNQRNYVTFFQEAAGTLYLIAVHKKKDQILATIQSLPGSGRSGIHLNGTKASLEVLLKDGNSQGWRGRVWSILAPPTPNAQKATPHSPVLLQERLWSRGDCLSAELNNICDQKVGAFRFYVSITPGQVQCLNSSFVDGDMSVKAESGTQNHSLKKPMVRSMEDPKQDGHEQDKIANPELKENSKTAPTGLDTDSSSSTAILCSTSNVSTDNSSGKSNSSNTCDPSSALESSNVDNSSTFPCTPKNNRRSNTEPSISITVPSSVVN